MAVYKKQISVGGKWVKGSELADIKIAKIVSETTPMESQFLNSDGSKKMQDVCRVRFGANEAVNISLNRATINGLVDAFGEDSKNWQGKILAVETEKMRVAGKAVIAIYLIPEGYERIDDENGYAVIVKKGEKPETLDPNFSDVEEPKPEIEF